MNEPKISVISPVHNSEEYLKRCVDSILSQTLSDIEVIFIDDASEDGSYDILKSYADSDPRVLIIKLDKNIGAGGARNLGIEAARGKYLYKKRQAVCHGYGQVSSCRRFAELLLKQKETNGGLS